MTTLPPRDVLYPAPSFFQADRYFVVEAKGGYVKRITRDDALTLIRVFGAETNRRAGDPYYVDENGTWEFRFTRF